MEKRFYRFQAAVGAFCNVYSGGSFHRPPIGRFDDESR
jgi:hypothetical protein